MVYHKTSFQYDCKAGANVGINTVGRQSRPTVLIVIKTESYFIKFAE